MVDAICNALLPRFFVDDEPWIVKAYRLENVEVPTRIGAHVYMTVPAGDHSRGRGAELAPDRGACAGDNALAPLNPAVTFGLLTVSGSCSTTVVLQL